MYSQIKLIVIVFMLILITTACNLASKNAELQAHPIVQEATVPLPQTPTETIPPSTPLPTLTPSNTLRPPPTFEPPTLTPQPSETPTVTPTSTIQIEGNLPDLQGLWTPTGQASEGCVPRDDWTLDYEVQPGDALGNIAPRYGTWANVLAEGNCIPDPSLIRVGQVLRVPGDLHPATPEFVCEWELLTPLNGTITVPGEGQLTFNWRGPETSRYLVRIYDNENGTGDHILEYMSEYNENYTMDLSNLPKAGTFSWRVFPLNWEFTQISCPESYPSRFTKASAPPTLPNTGGGNTSGTQQP